MTSPYVGLPSLFKNFTKKDNSNAILASLLKAFFFFDTRVPTYLVYLVVEINVGAASLIHLDIEIESSGTYSTGGRTFCVI